MKKLYKNRILQGRRFIKLFDGMRRSLSLKWSVSFGLILFCCVIATYFLSGSIINHFVTKQSLTTLKTVAENKKRILRIWIDDKKEICNGLAKSVMMNTVPSLTGDGRSGVKTKTLKYTSDNILSRHKEFSRILIFDEKLVPTFDTMAKAGSTANYNTPKFKNFLTTIAGTKISDSFTDLITGKRIQYVATKISMAESLCYYVVIEIDLRYLTENLFNDKVSGYGTTYIVTQDRTLITDQQTPETVPLSEQRINSDVVEMAYVHSVISGHFYNYKNENVLGVYQSIPELHWILAVEVDAQENVGLVRTLRNATVLSIIIGFGIILVLMQLFLNQFLKSLRDIQIQLKTMSNGDLSGQIVTRRIDEIGKFGDCFNTMKNALRTVLSNVKRQMTKFETAISQIVHTISQYDQTAAHQAIAIKETAASIEELNGTATKVMENVREVRSRVEETMETVLTLSNKAEEIEEISSSIDEVSVKINLLSLNASIEAARAGNHGKGFGVVAGEIRKLADYTNELTDRISVMIDDVQSLIRSTMVSAEAMVSEVQQISASVEDQTQGTSQISAAIDSIKEGIFQSAKGTSEISISVNELNEMAQDIQQLFEKFQFSKENVTKVTTNADTITTNIADKLISVPEQN